MKKLQKILFAVSLSTMGAFICFPIYAGTWSHDSNGWSYQSDDGNSPRGTWKKIDSKWYYFNKNGYMETGWIQYEKKWYYCYLNGELATNCWITGKYYVGNDGAMYVNTITPDGYKVGGDGEYVKESSIYGSYRFQNNDDDEVILTFVEKNLDGENNVMQIETNTDYRSFQLWGHFSYDNHKVTIIPRGHNLMDPGDIDGFTFGTFNGINKITLYSNYDNYYAGDYIRINNLKNKEGENIVLS